MKKITLKFKSPKELWEFKILAKLNSVEINLNSFTLMSEFNEEDICLARQKYHAQINHEQMSLALY